MLLKNIYLGLRKLDKLYIGLYKVKKNIKNVSYEINILGKTKIFPVFYVFLLKKVLLNCKPETFWSLNKPDDIYEVKNFLGENKLKSEIKFFVK